MKSIRPQSRFARNYRRPAAALLAAMLLLDAAPWAFAQTTITLTDGQIDTNAYDTTAPASPTTFTIATGTATVSGTISGTGSLTKSGSGTVTLSGANTYTGATTISNGTLALGAANVLSDTAALTVGSGATLDFANFSETVGSLAGAGSVTLGSGTLTTGGDNTSTIFTGLVSGTGGITKTGSGSLTLLFRNTYTGTTTVSAGTLVLNSPIGDIVNNASLTLVAADNYSGVISGSGSVTFRAVTLSGTNTYSGPTTIGHAFSGDTPIVGILTLGASDVLPDATAVTVQTGTIFDLANFTDTIGSLAGAGLVTLGSGSLTIGGDNTSTTFSGALDGTGSLVKTGTGTLSFSIPGTSSFNPGTRNGYNGNTRITGGLINFSNAWDFGNANTITLDGGGLQWATGSTADPSFKFTPLGSAGGTFDTNGNNVTFASALSGTGGINKVGTGSLTLGAGSTYSGTTTISAGTLQFGGGDSISGDIINNSALVFGGSADSTFSGWIRGSGPITKSGTGTTTLTGDLYNPVGAQSSLTIASGAIRFTDATGFVVYNPINNGTIIFDRNNPGTFENNITGTGSVLKTGTGTFTLRGTNTYSGGTTVAEGTLVVDSRASNALNTGPIAVTTGGHLNLSDSLTPQSTVSVDGAGSSLTTLGIGLNSSSFTITNGGTVSTSGNLMINADTATPTFTVTGAGSILHVGGSLQLVINALLSIADSATLQVGGSNGIVSVGDGTLHLSGGTLQVTGSDLTTTNFVTITLTDTATVDTNGFNATLSSVLSSVLSGTGSLTKTGTGTLTLSAANTYTGPTTVTGGLINFSSLANVGTGTVTLDGGGLQWATGNNTLDITGQVQFNRVLGPSGGIFDTNGNNIAFSSALSGSGGLTKSGAGTLTLSAANTYSGGTTISGGTLQLGNGGSTGSLSGNVSNQGTLAFNRNDDFVFGGVISGTGGLTLNNGILRLTQAQTYTGPTQINAGILVLPSTVDNGLSASALVTLASGAVLDISNRTQTIAGLAGAGTVYSFGGASGSLELAVPTGQSRTFSGSLGSSFTNFALTKSGPGTQTLSAANTYTGATTIQGGTLVLRGATQSTSALTVQAGGVLGLDVSAPVTAASANVNLGAGSVLITGTPALASHTLLIANSITGTPVLTSPVPGYQLEVFGGNELRLVQSASVSAFAAWAAINAPTGGPGDDFDADGVSNALEFVLGGTKNTADASKLPVANVSGGNLVFTFVRDQISADGVTGVKIEIGTTLAAWAGSYTVGTDTAGSTAGVTVSKNDPGAGLDTVSLTLPMAPDSKKFARLSVEIAP